MAVTEQRNLPPQAVAALHAGSVIEAVKYVRANTGCGLKDAKDQVDTYLLAHPALQAQIYARSGGINSVLSWVFTIAVAVAAIVYFWPRS